AGQREETARAAQPLRAEVVDGRLDERRPTVRESDAPAVVVRVAAVDARERVDSLTRRLHGAGQEIGVHQSSRRKDGTSSTSSGTSKPVCACGSRCFSSSEAKTEVCLRRLRWPPKPVAMTVTRTWSPSALSMTAPKMTFAF